MLKVFLQIKQKKLYLCFYIITLPFPDFQGGVNR